MSETPASRSVWQIAAGNAMRSYTETFLKYGVALLGPGWAGLWTRESKDGEFEGSYVRRFASQARIGDVFVLRNGTRAIVAIGLVASAYSFEHAFDDVNGWELQHARRVRWGRLPQEHQFGRAVFGGNPARFSRVWDQEVLDFAERFVNSPPTAWQTVPLPDLPVAEAPLVEVPDPLGNLVAQARDLQPLYWNQDRFGERPSEDEMIVHFVVPLLRGLGWPVEQIAVKWRNIDIAVFRALPRTAESCRFVIEAKRFGDGIEGAREQAKRYVEMLGLPRDVLVTDGIRYRMYGADRDFEPAAYGNLAQLKSSSADLFARVQRP
jgi:hypothetical protein